jgi:nucleoid DNA-binding protein
MRKLEIAKQLARQSGVTQGEAADRLDRVVRDILERLREGKVAAFPGMGHFRSGAGGKIDFERSRRSRDV